MLTGTLLYTTFHSITAPSVRPTLKAAQKTGAAHKVLWLLSVYSLPPRLPAMQAAGEGCMDHLPQWHGILSGKGRKQCWPC